MHAQYIRAVPELSNRRWTPFAIVGGVLAIVCIAILRLPESFVGQIERNRPFTSSQAGWAYRLLAFAAAGQALYGGFVLLRAERVEKARAKDPKVARMSREKILAVVTRNAATMVFWTIAYGVAAFAVTGQRGGFWLFPLIALVQGAWYIRQTGEVARWMRFQPEPAEEEPPRALWKREPDDYTPPILRGLVIAAPETAARPEG